MRRCSRCDVGWQVAAGGRSGGERCEAQRGAGIHISIGKKHVTKIRSKLEVFGFSLS